MEKISSRKNKYILHLRNLSNDSEYRKQSNEFLCDGYKLLEEAIKSGAKITSILYKEEPGKIPSVERQFCASADVFDFASPMKNSPGPLFTCEIRKKTQADRCKKVIVLENVQDPGNVGTVIRTANAFDIDAVILVGSCADIYNPKTSRATMGAIFRQNILTMNLDELQDFLKRNSLKLYGAALSDRAEDIRNISIKECAVAVGSEGHGLSREFLSICDCEIIIPMKPCTESLNASVAASVVMWEMWR